MHKLLQDCKVENINLSLKIHVHNKRTIRKHDDGKYSEKLQTAQFCVRRQTVPVMPLQRQYRNAYRFHM